MKQAILDFTLPEFEAEIVRRGHPAYRARQVFEWIFRKGLRDFAGMKNLSRALVAELSGDFEIFTACTVEVSNNVRDGAGAEKLLLEFPDGARTETVRIFEDERRTVCVSSQSGCPIGCAFCASGSTGLERSLAAGEMLQQVMLFGNGVEEEATNIVIMGMGEPLLNYDATLRFVRAATEPWGLAMGARRVTLSTVGIVDGIARLAAENLKINLAISLHAPNDGLRSKLIPRNDGVRAIVSAAADYFRRTGREVTFEYVLIDGVNCSPAHSDELARLLGRMQCTLNLIPLNPVPALAPEFHPPKPADSARFLAALKRCGLNVTMRKSRGDSIDAACGQLRLRKGKPR